MPLKKFLQQYPDTQYLDCMLCDLSNVMRGKRYPIGIAEKVFNGSMMFPGSSCFLSVNGECLDSEGMGFSDGDPDQVALAIPSTLVPSPWARYPTAQVMFTLQSLQGEAYFFEPRNVLLRVLERFKELSLTPVVAFELEFYLVDPSRENGQSLQPPRAPLSGQRSDSTQVYSVDRVEDFSHYLHEVVATCAQQGVACAAISAEYAPGQFEINLQHSDQPLALADQCVMFRRVVQCVARQHGLQATFMAKPHAERAGSGLHLHISLCNEAGENVFDGGGKDDTFGTPACTTRKLLHAIGGLKQSMPESMAIFAPNINSFHRFIPDNYVPVQPSWGYDNRSVAIRVPRSEGQARRVEHRVAGADANPYLTLAALLAAIHHGISNKIDCGKPSEGNAGAELSAELPFDLQTALEKCRNGKILRDYFGGAYIDLYCTTKRDEYRDFSASGKCEIDWYL